MATMPITWRLRVAAARDESPRTGAGPDAAAVRRAFFRAAASVPESKAVWLDGLAACAASPGALTDSETAQLLATAAADGRLRLRTDVYEVALERQAQAVLASS
jgi:hypothetical protein